MKPTQVLTEEEQNDIDKEFEEYIHKLPVVGHPDPTGKYLVVSKEEYDNWD